MNGGDVYIRAGEGEIVGAVQIGTESTPQIRLSGLDGELSLKGTSSSSSNGGAISVQSGDGTNSGSVDFGSSVAFEGKSGAVNLSTGTVVESMVHFLQ